jgi:hypothetical protein
MPWGAQSKNPTRGDAGLGRGKPPKQGRSVLLPKCNWVCAAPQKGKCAASGLGYRPAFPATKRGARSVSFGVSQGSEDIDRR